MGFIKKYDYSKFTMEIGDEFTLHTDKVYKIPTQYEYMLATNNKKAIQITKKMLIESKGSFFLSLLQGNKNFKVSNIENKIFTLDSI